MSGEATLLTTRRRIDKAYEFDAVDVSSGFGSFAKARERMTGAFRAIKAVPKSSVADPGRLRADMLASAGLDHPHVVRVHDVFEDRRLLYMVTELCTGGALLDRILIDHDISESHVARVVRQVLSALGYCHSKGVVHLDLNPDCCMFVDAQDSSPLKVTGFGLASRLTPERVAANITSAVYCAPELLRGSDGVASAGGPEADVWSAGVIAFVLLAGEAPFGAGGDWPAEPQNCTAADKAWKGFSERASADARHFVEQQLQDDVRSRPSAVELLQHPWVLRHCSPAAPRTPTREETRTSPEALERLKDFRREANIRHAEQAVLIRQLVEDELRRLKELFVALDRGQSGALTCERLREGFRDARMPVPPELLEVFNEAERDPGCDDNRASEGQASAVITYTEFVSTMMEHHLRRRREAVSNGGRKNGFG